MKHCISKNHGYRPDIDGLRAVAIVFVLIYHGGLPLFPSGFIGVDVFFVISGYLITSILSQSLTEGRFSFLDFYKRRLWRLQPVLICMLFVTTLLTFCFFLPDDLIDYARSARKTALFISNIYFNQTTSNYFSPDSHQLPLLHTWSLSIEWQCYLILPFFMYGLQRVLGKQWIAPVVYLLTLGFGLLALHNSSRLPAETYYLFSSRVFEFLIGASLALTPLETWKFLRPGHGVLGLVALAGLVYIGHQDNILLGYPNGYALWVCLFTGSLIAIGSNQGDHFWTRLLSSRPIVLIGLLSYSLYIWHWLVFSLIRYQSLKESPWVLLFAYSLTFILAYLSWRFIEKPARNFKTLSFSYTFCFLLLLPILSLHLTSYVIKGHAGFPQRFNHELVDIYQQLARYSNENRPLCIDNKAYEDPRCFLGADSSSQKALLIGDSFSNHYWGMMDTFGKEAGLRILALGTSSCLTLPGLYLYDWWHYKDQVYQRCYDNTQAYYSMIDQGHYQYVILGQVWANYLGDHLIQQPGDTRSLALSQQRLSQALDRALQRIISSGARPVIIQTTATMKDNFHDCFYRHIKQRQTYKPEECSFKLVSSPEEVWFEQLFAAMKRKYPQLVLIDPKKVQCEQGVCKADMNGIPIYRDVGHITDYASYQMGKHYLQTYGNPFKFS